MTVIDDPLTMPKTGRDRSRCRHRHRYRDLGSAPRPTGSHLVIDGEGNFEGSVSGGCVEGAVITRRWMSFQSGAPRMLEFGVADETAWRVGLSCGGAHPAFMWRGWPHEAGTAGKIEYGAARASGRGPDSFRWMAVKVWSLSRERRHRTLSPRRLRAAYLSGKAG